MASLDKDNRKVVPVFLRQFDGLLDDSLQFIVVSELSVAGQGEILAQGMAIKSERNGSIIKDRHIINKLPANPIS